VGRLIVPSTFPWWAETATGACCGGRGGHILFLGKIPGAVVIVEEGLQGVRFFEFPTEEEREEFAEDSESATFEAGDKIIEEGAEPGNLFVLTSGSVEVSKKIPGGGDLLLARIDVAEGRTVVGERGLLGESGASATVRAADPVEAIKIPRETFRRMVSEGRPAAFKLSYRIARTLARRLTRLDEEVVEAIRELESRGETDLEAFRDKLITDWAI
jgi:CRP/FNR family transcriptional regulator, cyclic AMP receptor protein